MAIKLVETSLPKDDSLASESAYLAGQLTPVQVGTLHCDDLIIGGGCSGLLLACGLADRFPDRKIVILEGRSQYLRDRTWCSWRFDPENGLNTDHLWNKWSVSNTETRAAITGTNSTYHCVTADHFYRERLAELQSFPNIQMVLGTKVRSIKRDQLGLSVRSTSFLNSGTQAHAQRIFDSRMPSLASCRMKQTFFGQHVRSKTACFDPGSVTLMDFAPQAEGEILFFYVLPFSRYEALVETTVIGTTIPSQRYLRQKLRSYLDGRAIHDFEIDYEESGLLPMSTEFGNQVESADSVTIPIGLARGLARPASGYSFDEIGTWTNAFLSRLNSSGVLEGEMPLPRPRYLTKLDRIFLNHIEHNPAEAPGLFVRLFGGTSPDTMPRFLSNRPTAADLVQIIRSLPLTPMLRSAIDLWTNSIGDLSG